MPQLLASLNDISKHLPDHKVEATDSNTSQWQLEASRIVKAKLFGFFPPVVLHGWASPSTTPPIIRSIAGELIAAYLYRSLYSEDETTVPMYAQTLYNEAVALLNQIRDGELVVLDDNDNPIETGDTISLQGSSYPDDTAPGPYFKMADTWS